MGERQAAPTGNHKSRDRFLCRHSSASATPIRRGNRQKRQGVGVEALEPADHGVSGPLPAGGDQAISNWSPSHGAGHGEGVLDIMKSSWGGGHGESDVAVDTMRRRRSG